MSIPDTADSDLRLPDFLCVGPARTGTSWLHAVLKDHVGLPLIKETNFFGLRYDLGLDWYARCFQHPRPDRPLGEICALYFHQEQARERIARHIPRCKIVITLRDPVERGYSMFKMMRHFGAIPDIAFEKAIATIRPIIESNRYADHVAAWLSRFGAEQVLILFYDDLRADPQAFVDRVCDFIGAGRLSLQDVRVSRRAEHSFARAPKNRRLASRARRLMERMEERHSYTGIKLLEWTRVWDFCFGRGKKFPPLDSALEARLRESMRPEIEKLEHMTGRDLSAWKNGAATSHANARGAQQLAAG